MKVLLTRVLLTHGEGRLEGLAEALSAQGFDVTHEPFIKTEFLPVNQARAAAEGLFGADWLLFTSRTAVKAWVNLALPLDPYKIGVVGQKTAEEIERANGTVSLVAEPANAKGFLDTFLACVSLPSRVGLPCGERALPTLSTGLSEAGFTVQKAVLYRTALQLAPHLDADFIVLASPSAVAALPEPAGQTQLVALGPSTYQAVKARGWHAAEAQTPDVKGVVQALFTAITATLPAAQVELAQPKNQPGEL